MKHRRLPSRFTSAAAAALLAFSAFLAPLSAKAAVYDLPENEIVEYAMTPAGSVSPTGYIEYEYLDRNGVPDPSEQHETDSAEMAAVLPASYDSRTTGAVPAVGDQGNSGTCWAFSAISAAEISAMSKGVVSGSLNLSEVALAWFARNQRTTNHSDLTYGDGSNNSAPYDAGGNWRIAASAMARWSAGELESNLSTDWHGNYRSTTVSEDLRYVTELKLKNAREITGTSNIKQAIMENGALMCSMYEVSSYFTYGDFTTSYYYPGTQPTNHAVTVIGWDDNYSRSSFGANAPAHNGAWLIRNSWGKYWGDDGYFWISYDDNSFGNFVAFDMMAPSTYDYNYQYDGAPDGTYLSLGSDHDAKSANVFTAAGHEMLQSVSFFSNNRNADYTVNVYLDPNTSSPESGRLVNTATKSFRESGYLTIQFSSPTELQAGQRFSVVLSAHTTDERVRVSVEGSNNSTAHSEAGQSYYKFTSQSRWYDSYGQYNNVCIKAQTTDIDSHDKAALAALVDAVKSRGTSSCASQYAAAQSVLSNSGASFNSIQNALLRLKAASGLNDPAASVKLNAVSLALKTGDKFAFRANLQPSTATDDVYYTINKPSVASITPNGILTALAPGSCTLTVHAGSKTDTCLVVVTNPLAKPTPTPDNAGIKRLYGSDRILTALSISAAGWASSDAAVIANGFSFPDALAGVPLAHALDAPILLTSGTATELSVIEELERLKASNVYLLGGTGAISAGVEETLRRSGCNVKRIYGPDRYATAVKIAEEMASLTTLSNELFFASGANFPDALSGSTVAALIGSPVLYLPASGSADAKTLSFILSSGCNSAVILGGTAAVSAETAETVSSTGLEVTRISGTNRYVTSLRVCQTYARLFSGSGAAIATGTSFPDALSGGAFAAKNSIPVLLVGGSVPGDLHSFVASLHPDTLYVFGGKAAVPCAIANELIG